MCSGKPLCLLIPLVIGIVLEFNGKFRLDSALCRVGEKDKYKFSG